MMKYLLVVAMYGMMNNADVIYVGTHQCMKFDDAKKCVEIRSQIIDQARDLEDRKLYVTHCVPFEITEDFHEENAVEACNQAVDKGVKEYGQATSKFRF